MAKATIEKTITTVNLILSQEEAETLAAICTHVGGFAMVGETRKRHTDNVLEALRSCGICTFDRDLTGEVWFAREITR